MILLDDLAALTLEMVHAVSPSLGLEPAALDLHSEKGWLTVLGAFCNIQGDKSLGFLAHLALTQYLLGAGLPADHTLADQAFVLFWRTVAVHLHGLLTSDPEEYAEVLPITQQWLSEAAAQQLVA